MRMINKPSRNRAEDRARGGDPERSMAAAPARRSRCKPLGWLVAAGLLLVACGADPKPEPETPIDVSDSGRAKATPKTDPAEKKEDDGSKGTVSLDPRIVDLCKLDEPKFDFDSSAVGPQAAKVLDAMASCFVDGAAKGKKLKLVGHADPRGETVYNFGLGQRRAGAVVQYLQKKGLTADRMASSSRGALDATGTDETGWAKDRRVDIMLGE
jgi:peptidoglycan-associated lipoprotein